jgi:hypothetical protein
MQQTLLAMLALMIVSVLSFNQKRAQLYAQQGAVRAEIEEMAMSVAQRSMEVVSARAFDETTTERASGLPVDLSALTGGPACEEGAGSTCDCQAFGGTRTCDDIDDFHNMEPATMSFALPSGEVDFTVTVRVRYVDVDLRPISGPSQQKEVTVSVQHAPEAGPPLLPKPIRHTEVFSHL